MASVDELMQRYLRDDATADEVAELEALLADDPALRKRFVFDVQTETGLREIAMERLTEGAVDEREVVRFPRGAWWGIAAALALLLSNLVWVQRSTPKTIATIASVEDASWQSSLPTEEGAKLSKGYLKLTTGLAVIEFRSGAKVTLEAPAKLILKSPMRGKLVSGSALVSVPEPAIGFVLETPDGFVVDHGTEFVATAAGRKGGSVFEVIEGEITVHLPDSDDGLRLVDQQSAAISNHTLAALKGEREAQSVEQPSETVRVGTDGRAGSVVRVNKKLGLHPEMLMCKTGTKPNWDRRSFFAFDLSDVDLAEMESVRLRLNLVPSGVGLASRLPKTNHFSVYGVVQPIAVDWDAEHRWETSPGPEHGVLVGTFEIPRSIQRGSYGVDGVELLDFIRAHADAEVVFVIVRDSLPETGGLGRGLVHAFANDTHPEAAGPMLEFSKVKR